MTGALRTRTATRSDIVSFYGDIPAQTFRAWVLEDDEEIKGVAGYYAMGDMVVVFSDVKEGVPKMTIWRQAKALMESIPGPAICYSNDSKPFLERLGWEDTGDGVFKWNF